jgi:hypothetical protein
MNSTSQRLAVFTAIALGSILGSACQPKVEIPQLPEATENIKKAAQSLQQGMTELSKVDPAGLKHLMEQNDQLRAVAEALRGELQSIQSPGNIGVGPHSRAFLEITGYRGRIRLDAWLDSEANKFISNSVLLDNEVPFPLDATIGHKQVEGTMDFCKNDSACFLKYMTMGAGKGMIIDQEYAKAAQDALTRFLQKPFVLPSADMQVHDFGQRFGTSGEHSLYFRVTPEKLDSEGHWVLEYKAYVLTADNQKEQFLVGRVDGETTPYTLGKPLPPILGNVFKVVIVDH